MQSSAQGNELDRLKKLLLQPEQVELDRIRRDLDGVNQHVGTKERLEIATAHVLVDAFRRAELAQHRELANAVAPVVVAAIQSEIRNSRDMMVEALYPITGRLVAAAVASAFSNLARRIEELMSARGLRWRMRAMLTGRSVAEIALAESSSPSVRKLIALERGSGILIAYWDANPEGGMNADLVSGMIAAITDFSASVFDQQAGELRALDFGSARIYLRASARTIVAAEVAGPVLDSHEGELNALLSSIIVDRDRQMPLSADALGRQANDIFAEGSASTRDRRSRRVLPVLLLVLLGLLAWAGYTGFTRWRIEANVQRAIGAVMAQHPHLASFPIAVSYAHGRRSIDLKGLVSTRDEAQTLATATKSAAPSYAFNVSLTPVALDSRVGALVSQLEKDTLAQLKALRVSELEQIKRAIGDIAARQSKEVVERAKDIGRLRSDIDIVAGRLAGESARLQKEARSADAAAGIRIQALGKSIADISRDIGQIAAIRKQLEAIDRDLGKRVQSVASALATVQTGVASAGAEVGSLSRQVKDNANATAKASAILGSSEFRLRAFLPTAAIFFSQDTDLNDAVQAAAVLDRLATLQKASGRAIRIVGYSDGSGSTNLNESLSLARARYVSQLLAQRGVDAGMLAVVGRAAALPIADTASESKANNRRVTFELVYDSERLPR